MPEVTASRTLVKSAPELWAECSDAASLAKHLGAFGEITITKLEPESAVAWEGAAARGTVRLEPSGWGTKVVLTATETGAAPKPEATAPGPEPTAPEDEPPAEPRSLWRRMFGRRTRPAPEPAEAPAAPSPATDSPAADPLDAALDSLGSAHHRPYSRS